MLKEYIKLIDKEIESAKDYSKYAEMNPDIYDRFKQFSQNAINQGRQLYEIMINNIVDNETITSEELKLILKELFDSKFNSIEK